MGSFYDLNNRYVYSELTYGFPWVSEATSMKGDCSQTDKPCAHIIPEVWKGATGTEKCK